MKSLKAKLASFRVKRGQDGSQVGADTGLRIGGEMGAIDDARAVGAGGRPRLVVAHFMLGNTYNFNDELWLQTFEEVSATGLDGLALNLGPEDWQFAQARSAFHVLAQSRFSSSSAPAHGHVHEISRRPLRLFISMDMNVLPATSPAEAQALKDKVLALLRMEDGILSEIAKGECDNGEEGEASKGDEGGQGWGVWLKSLEAELGEEVCFWPSFFLPPSELVSLPYTRGHFSWNAAWPMSSPTPESLSLQHTDPLLYPPFSSDSSTAPTGSATDRTLSYMTSISPCFYTHYAAPGSTPSGAWEWGKNWLYASDDMLMLRRWEQLLELDHCSALAMQEGQGGGDDSTSPAGIGRSPDIVQVISWNDYGESHYICPSVLGCQPGSEAWVDGMPHRAFAEMTRWMAGRWRDGKGEVELLYDDAKRRVARGSENGADVEPRAKVWIWYRIHPAGATATGDERGKPGHVDRAVDLFKIVVLLPHQASTAGQSDSFGESEEHSQYVLVLHNGPTSDTAPHAHEHSVRLRSGGATAFTVPFVPGPVGLGIRQKGIDGENAGRLVWQAEGAEIHAEPRTWNYNFWSYSWDVDLWS